MEELCRKLCVIFNMKFVATLGRISIVVGLYLDNFMYSTPIHAYKMYRK